MAYFFLMPALDGPIKPQNPIGLLAATLRLFKPLVNEKDEFTGHFIPRDDKSKVPDRDGLILLAGEAITEVHEFITQYRQAQQDNTKLIVNFKALRDDYAQIADILNHFINLNAKDTAAIERAQTAARDYLLRLSGQSKPVATGDTSTVDGQHPTLSILPKPEEDTQGGDSTLGVGGK